LGISFAQGDWWQCNLVSFHADILANMGCFEIIVQRF
jgi:hypothetical protein